jgi:decarbamoylnovobiocin carbamoyltransferase/7-O-carbamoyltransferase
MLVLGLSGGFSGESWNLCPDVSILFTHDAAACLIRDGELVAAVEEERLNRIKKTVKFPVNAVRACLDLANVSPAEIDAVGHYFPEESMNEGLNAIYRGYPATPVHSARELHMGHLKGGLGFDLPDDRLFYFEHHRSHAMSVFARSGMKEALVVAMDGRGEKHSTTIYHGGRGQLESLATHNIDKSLGQFYAAAIESLAYRFSDEYKVMGLAPYGNPATYRNVFSEMYTLKDDGDYTLISLAELRNATLPMRRMGEEFRQEHKDFAAGLQHLLETIAMHIISYWAKSTGLRNLCFVGGVAANSSLNGVILRSGLFEEVFIHPASHDAGAAEGAALMAADRLGASPFGLPRMRSASVGPGLGSITQVEDALGAWGDLVEYERSSDIVEDAARLLADGAVLGWAHGRSEFGPRALGNRSILADARPAENKEKINAMVKKRESFRPFAPVVTPEAAPAYFDLPKTRANYDFMSFVVDVREDRRAELGAVTHVDGTARIQIIDPVSNERFYRLVRRFGELTGTPVLLNTSFNNNAEPIVQSVQDVLTCYLTTGLDFVVIEDFMVRRREGTSLALDSLVVKYRPVTRMAKRTWLTPEGKREVQHSIFLDNAPWPSAIISPSVFAILEAADGKQSLAALAEAVGGLTEDLRRELYSLWQDRYFTLEPSSTTAFTLERP